MKPTLLLLFSRFAIPQASVMSLYFANLPTHFAVELSILSAVALGALTVVLYRSFPRHYWFGKVPLNHDHEVPAKLGSEHGIGQFVFFVNVVAVIVFAVRLGMQIWAGPQSPESWIIAVLELLLQTFILFGFEILVDRIVEFFKANMPNKTA